VCVCDKRLRGELKQKPVAMIALLIAYLLTSRGTHVTAIYATDSGVCFMQSNVQNIVP
jgi:hypothetical protein